MVDPISLAKALIAAESVTPAAGEVFDVAERALAQAGFTVTRITFQAEGTPAVENLYATRGSGRHLAFAGHLDVVPPGPLEDWDTPPFDPAIDGDTLSGRGAVDMKGGVAAMIAAGADWAQSGAEGQVSFVITGDEEGPAVNGTLPLMQWCAERTRFDGCIVGEPTSRTRLGDTIKVGRRGSLSGTVVVGGRQGHVAYQHAAHNPVPECLAIGAALNASLDDGTDEFAPSNLEIVSVDVGNTAWNVIPPSIALRFNVRFNDIWTVESLQAELSARIKAAAPDADATISFLPSFGAFLTRDTALIEAVSDAVEASTGVRPEATTGGGTSDARFIKDFCPVVEFGDVGTTMHQVNERTSIAQLRALTTAYRTIIDRVLCSP